MRPVECRRMSAGENRLVDGAMALGATRRTYKRCRLGLEWMLRSKTLSFAKRLGRSIPIVLLQEAAAEQPACFGVLIRAAGECRCHGLLRPGRLPVLEQGTNQKLLNRDYGKRLG